MRLAWLTDIHLNFVTPDRIADFGCQVQQTSPDAVLVGGDIGEADNFATFLRRLSEAVDVPLYFVLGNHDYYRGSIAQVRADARSVSRSSPRLKWLPETGIVRLTDRTALVGHGGWGDGRIGDFLASDVLLNDYARIRELRDCHHPDALPPESMLTPELLETLHALGDEAAEHFRSVLPQALEAYAHVLVLTHVPPFHEACWHDGRLSDGNWSPHFTCRAVGDVLVEFMRQHPDREMTVLCGHTHSSGRAKILNNLEVLTGAARYGYPKVEQMLEFAADASDPRRSA